VFPHGTGKRTSLGHAVLRGLDGRRIRQRLAAAGGSATGTPGWLRTFGLLGQALRFSTSLCWRRDGTDFPRCKPNLPTSTANAVGSSPMNPRARSKPPGGASSNCLRASGDCFPPKALNVNERFLVGADIRCPGVVSSTVGFQLLLQLVNLRGQLAHPVQIEVSLGGGGSQVQFHDFVIVAPFERLVVFGCCFA